MPKTGLRLVAIGVAATLLLTGCIPGESDGSAQVKRVELYWGAIPEPSPLPAGETPEMPELPSDPTDQAAMDAFIEEMERLSAEAMDSQGPMMEQARAIQEVADATQDGGEKAVAAWQSLLVMAGIAVVGADGNLVEINGSTGAGFPVTDPELRIHSAMSSAAGGLALTELASLIASALEVDDRGLAEALHDDLISSADPGFAQVFFAAGPAVFGGQNLLPFDEVVLEWDQVGLVLRRLSVDLATRSAAGAVPRAVGASAGRGQVVMGPVAAGAVKAAASGNACKLDSDPYAPTAVEFLGRGSAAAFEKVLDLLGDAGVVNAGGIGNLLAGAGMLSTIANYLIKAALLTAEFSLHDSPLIRTKTNKPGEIRDLDITFSFDKHAWEDAARCLNLFASFAGISIPTTNSGTADNIGVDLRTTNASVLRIGDNLGGASPVTVGRTGKDGKATFKLSGAPYAEKIPEQATPYERVVTVRAESNVGSNDFWNDLMSLSGFITGGGFGALVGGATAAISRMKILSHHHDITVRDWDVSAEFRVSLTGTIDTRSAWNRVSGANQCGPGGTLRSGSVQSHTDMVERQTVDIRAVLVSGGSYHADQLVALEPLKDESYTPIVVDGRLNLFEIVAANDTTKTHTEPGGEGLPPLHQEPDDFQAGCGDGGGGGQVAPPSDCGLRLYDAPLTVAQISAKKLFVGVDEWPNASAWEECGRGLYPEPTPVATDDCHGTFESEGGRMPSINDTFDDSKTALTIEGTITCTDNFPGEVNEMIYRWKLTLCRLDDGGHPMKEC